jgi:hypothetical protein
MSDPYTLYRVACDRISDRISEVEQDQLIAAARSPRTRTFRVDLFAALRLTRALPVRVKPSRPAPTI